MEVEASVTVDIQNYRLILPSGHSTFLLQCPVPQPDLHDTTILVRQDQDVYNNEVSFKAPGQLVSVDDPPHTTYVHGVMLMSRPGDDCRKGDAVWLYDAQWKPGSGLDPNTAAVVNLRTWKCLTVGLREVCWVPKFRKLDHGVGEEELLTISGRPVRHNLTKKTYFLAIVQRLGAGDSFGTKRDDPGVEIKEFVEQEIFKYQNLCKLADGTKKIKELFVRALSKRASLPGHPVGQARLVACGHTAGPLASILATPPSEDDEYSVDEEEDSEFEREAEQLIREGMAKLTRPPMPVMPKQLCNLPADECPTHPGLFFATRATRPSWTNWYPTHHHVLDAQCPEGAAHELHCVYASPHAPDCILPPTVRHMCCATVVHPRNKRITRPPTMVAPPPAARGGGASVVVKRGSGVTVVSAAAAGAAGWDADWDAIADVPVDVEVLKFDARTRRDLDARGRRLMVVGVREDVSEHGEWKYAQASLDGLIGDLCAPSGTPAVAFSAGCLLDAEWMPGMGGGPGQQQLRPQEEPDVFGDRHCHGYGGDDEDIGDDASLEGDTGTDMELDGDDD